MSEAAYHFAMFGGGVVLTFWLFDDGKPRWGAVMALMTALQLLMALAA